MVGLRRVPVQAVEAEVGTKPTCTLICSFESGLNGYAERHLCFGINKVTAPLRGPLDITGTTLCSPQMFFLKKTACT